MNFRKWLNFLIVSACCATSTAGAQTPTSLLDPWAPAIPDVVLGLIIQNGTLGFALPSKGATVYYTTDGGSSWQPTSLPSYLPRVPSSKLNASWLRAFIWNGEIYLYEHVMDEIKGYYSIMKLDTDRSEWIELKRFLPAVEKAPGQSATKLSIHPFEGSWMALDEYMKDYLLLKTDVYQVTSPSGWILMGTTTRENPQFSYRPSSGIHIIHRDLRVFNYQDFYPYSVSPRNGLVVGEGFDPDVWDPSGPLPPPFLPLRYPVSTAWTRDGIHWGPIPSDEMDNRGLNATDWPVGMLAAAVVPPPESGWVYFGEGRTLLTDNRITNPRLLKGEEILITSRDVSTDEWSVFELVDGEFIERASGLEFRPQGRLGGVWLSDNRASYDLIDWVELPAKADDLIIRDDRFLDTRTGYTSPELTPWPLAHRRDSDWVEDRYFGWVHDKYYPWVYIYTFGEGLEDGWFYIGWRWDNQAYVWSDIRQEWVWVERESWPRAWSFTTEDWIGGAP